MVCGASTGTIPFPVWLVCGVSQGPLSHLRLFVSISHNPSPSYPYLSHPVTHNHRFPCRIFAKNQPNSSITYAFYTSSSTTLSHTYLLIVVIYTFRPIPTNRNLPSFRQAFLSRLPSIDIPIPQYQSCQTSTTALLTTPLLCSRTLTLLTTTTVARVAGLVSHRLRMPTVNSSSKLKEAPRSFPRLLPTTHTSETSRLPRVSSLRMTRSSAPSTS